MSSSLVMQASHMPSSTEVSEDPTLKLEDINPKLVKVLKKLLEPKFKLHNNDYLNLLLMHLTNVKEQKFTLQQRELNKSFLILWLKGSIIHFEKIEEEPNQNILTFVLNMAIFISKSEQVFVQLHSEDVFKRLITIVRRVSQPNVTTTFLKLLTSLMEHKSGLQWIISTNHWKFLVDLILNSQTIYLSQEGIKFIAKLLNKSHSFNPTFCKNVIQNILAPLKGSTESAISSNQDNQLGSTVKIVNEVLIGLLELGISVDENLVILMLIEEFDLEQHCKNVLHNVKDLNINLALYKTVLILCIYDLKLDICGKKRASVRNVNLSEKIADTLYEVLTQISVSSMLQLLFSVFSCWDIVRKSLPQSTLSNSTRTCFEDQLMFLVITPVYTLFIKNIGFNIVDTDDDNAFKFVFISKLMKRACPNILRINYKWRNYLLDNYSFNNGIMALKYFTYLVKFYSKDMAVVSFQMMMYLIQDLCVTLREKPEVQIPFSNEPDYLDLHLKNICLIIDEFNLTWHDSVESLCVLYNVYCLLNDMIWPTKIVVTALKLAEKGISKYMTYQLAFIVDNSEDSRVIDFPGLLRTKMYDGAWEVRDSAIEVLQSLIVAVKKTELSSYKNLILKHQYPGSILKMATDDGNPFVRASALKCTQKAIEITEFWDEVVGTSNIYATVLKILKCETEGIVRCEAATLVDCIYEHHDIPEDLKDNFFDVMSHAVVADLHWEVRVKALKFWKRIVNHHLTQQGMIDGSFPTVTFSKELRKIVTLSTLEVQKRLVRILYELSENGCLAVFYDALRDECDIEVSKFATESIKHFVDLLKNHNITVESLQVHRPSLPVIETCEQEEISALAVEQSIIDEILTPESMQLHQISDLVMDEILNTKDLNLLETVYNSMDQPVLENIETKKRKRLNPELFLNLVYSDLDDRIDEKTKWINQLDDFQSLLDDILKDYEVTDVNSMDCY